MLRDLLKEGGLYTISSFLTKGVSLLLLPFYAAYFSPADYGILDILTVFGTLINAVISLQLYQGLGRYIGEPSLTDDKKHVIASTAIWVTTLIYLVSTILIILFPDFAIRILSTHETTIPVHTFMLSVMAVSINGIFYILNVYIRFLRNVRAYAITSFLHAILNILLTIYFVLIENMGIDGIFIASIVVTPVIVIGQFIILKGKVILTIRYEQFKKLLKFSLPLVPAAMAYIVLNFTDRLFIKSYLSFSDDGIYAMGSKFSTVISVIILGFSSALAPIIYQKHKDENTKAELGRIFRLFFAIGTTGVLCLSLFAHETLVIFTNEKYYGAALVMPFLYTSFFISGFGMFSPGLHLQEKTGLIALIVIISGGFNVILNYFLISQFQLVGAAFSTLLCVLFNNLVLFIASQKYYPFRVHYKPILVSGGVFLLFAGLSLYYLPLFNLPAIAQVFIKILLIVIYIIMVNQLKMVNLKRFLSLNK